MEEFKEVLKTLEDSNKKRWDGLYNNLSKLKDKDQKSQLEKLLSDAQNVKTNKDAEAIQSRVFNILNK